MPERTLFEQQACQKPGQPCYDIGSQEVGSWWREIHNCACMRLGSMLIAAWIREYRNSETIVKLDDIVTSHNIGATS